MKAGAPWTDNNYHFYKKHSYLLKPREFLLFSGPSGTAMVSYHHSQLPLGLNKEDAMTNQATTTALNQVIADISQLRVNVQQYHWYMRGEQFFKLHPLMDDYLAQLGTHLDEVAERLIIIGGAPLSTTHEFTAHTKLPDDKLTWGQEPLTQMVAGLVRQFKVLRDDYAAAIAVTEDAHDLTTQDMLIEFKGECEKNIWMLNAYLGKDATA